MINSMGTQPIPARPADRWSHRIHRSLHDLDDSTSRWTIELPGDAEAVEVGPWVHVRQEGSTRADAGWKIHVSATPSTAPLCLSVVARICGRDRVDYKFVRSAQLLRETNGKHANRASAGKFIAIYPSDDAEALRLLDELAVALERLPGPYILNDIQWRPDSPVFARFGAFRKFVARSSEPPVMQVPLADGRWAEDRRVPYFSLPDGFEATPPFDDHIASSRDASRIPSPPFVIDEALQFSNGGGVYKGRLPDGRIVAVKEARPNTAFFGQYDSAARLAHEYQILAHLRGMRGVVRAHELTRLWNNWYLVEEFIEGVTLAQACRDKCASSSTDEFAAWAERVFAGIRDTVALIHAADVVIGDIHTGNLMVTADETAVIVDLESASMIGSQSLFPANASGFQPPTELRDSVEGDLFSLDVLHLAMYSDLFRMRSLDESALNEAAHRIREEYGVVVKRFVGKTASESRSGGAPADPASLAHSILGHRRSDAEGLFYGDAASTDALVGPSLAHGTAGTLVALGLSGYDICSEDLDWLAENADRYRAERALSFAEGTLGIAHALTLLDRAEGLPLLRYCLPYEGLLRSWQLGGGKAGLVVALASALARRSGDEELLIPARRLAEEAVEEGLDSPDVADRAVAVAAIASTGVLASQPRERARAFVEASLRRLMSDADDELGGSARVRGLLLSTTAAAHLGVLHNSSFDEDERRAVYTRIRSLSMPSHRLVEGIPANILAHLELFPQPDAEGELSRQVARLTPYVVTGPAPGEVNVPSASLTHISDDISAGAGSMLIALTSVEQRRNLLRDCLFGTSPRRTCDTRGFDLNVRITRPGATTVASSSKK